MPRWNGQPNSFFRDVALRLPQNLQLLIMGSLGWDFSTAGSWLAYVAAYGSYLADFVFCLARPGKRAFAVAIALLLVLLIFGMCGSSWYVRNTFQPS
jgi:hypothetical protein